MSIKAVLEQFAPWSSHKSHSFHVKLCPHFNEIVCMGKISLAIYNVYYTGKQFLLATIYLAEESNHKCNLP